MATSKETPEIELEVCTIELTSKTADLNHPLRGFDT
jgi:FKBP-type peptidyl-prolyl cis-trans isomerase 2